MKQQWMNLLQPSTPKMMVLDNSLHCYRALHKSLRKQHRFAVPRVFSPTQRDQSSSVGRRPHDDGMSSGVGTWEECWKTEKNERPSWNVHFIGMCKEKTFQQKIHLVIFWVPGAHGNCNPVN